jgi:uroporphyrinogen decarboxylase
MNRKTRLENAIRKKEVDRVPVSFWYHFEGEDTEGEACVQAHVRHYRETGIDFIKVMCDGLFEYPISYLPEKSSDWNKVRPIGKDHPHIKAQVERVRRICEETKDECCVFYTLFAPFSIVRFVTSDEIVMEHLKENEAGMMSALNAISEDHITLCEALFEETGCSGVYFSVQGGEKNRFSIPEYKRIVSPSDLAVLNCANRYSDLNLLHLCAWAGDPNNLEVWEDYPGPVFNWAVYIEDLSMKAGESRFDEKAIMGGFDNRKTGVLYSGTTEEIKAFTENLVDEVGAIDKTGIIIGADCTLPGDIDKNRIKTVVDTLDGLRK